MYTSLETVTLKSGEELEVGVVRAPDPQWAEPIQDLLGHKPGNFRWHIERSGLEVLDGLETWFYLGILNGQAVANIMTVEARGVGILGHVFTRPEHRRKGAITAVMQRQMADFRRRGGQLLLLGTGFESPPYWIYHRFGFRSLTGDTGFMRYACDEDFEARWFAPAPARIVEVAWQHWPLMNLLCAQRDGDWLRSLAFGHYGLQNFEGGFLNFKRALEEQPDCQARLLEAANGAVVGYAVQQPDARWENHTFLLDCFVHPNFAAHTASLIAALDPPAAKVQAYADSASPAKIAALEACGFRREAVLSKQVRRGEDWLDVLVYARA